MKGTPETLSTMKNEMGYGSITGTPETLSTMHNGLLPHEGYTKDAVYDAERAMGP